MCCNGVAVKGARVLSSGEGKSWVQISSRSLVDHKSVITNTTIAINSYSFFSSEKITFILFNLTLQRLIFEKISVTFKV